MILVTGCAGFVGSNIVKRLLLEGHDVIGVDDLSFGDEANVPKELTWYKMKFEDLTECKMNKCDILIHAATANIIYAMDNPVETFKTNAEGTLKLFDKFAGKIIYLSTASVYGNALLLPTSEDAEAQTTNAYDLSKYVAEIALKLRGDYTTLRLSNVYGEQQRASNPYCGVIGKLVHAAMRDIAFTITGGWESTRDYTYIQDVEDAVLLAIKTKSFNTEFNIATGIETSIEGLIVAVREITGKKVYFGSTTPRKIDGITRRCLDIKKAKRFLKWKPTTNLLQGLAFTIDWYKHDRHIK